MAGWNPNARLAARLAATTAMLSVLSGCGGGIANTFNDMIAPVQAEIGSYRFLEENKPAPDTARAVVIAPSAPVGPGNPTYLASSRAEDLARFEALYGRPVAGSGVAPVEAVASYRVPSYDDGVLDAQPLAPVSTATVAYAPAPVQTLPQSYATVEPILQPAIYEDSLMTAGVPILGNPAPLDTGMMDSMTSYASTGFESYTATTADYAEIAPVLGTESLDTASGYISEPALNATYNAFSSDGPSRSVEIAGLGGAYADEIVNVTPIVEPSEFAMSRMIESAPMPLEPVVEYGVSEPAMPEIGGFDYALPADDSLNGAYQVAEPEFGRSSGLIESMPLDSIDDSMFEMAAAVPMPVPRPMFSEDQPQPQVDGLAIMAPEEYGFGAVEAPMVAESIPEEMPSFATVNGVGFGDVPVGFADAPVEFAQAPVLGQAFTPAPAPVAVAPAEPRFVALAATPLPSRKVALTAAPAPRAKPVMMAQAPIPQPAPRPLDAANARSVTTTAIAAQVEPAPAPGAVYDNPVVTQATASAAVQIPVDEGMAQNAEVAPMIEVEPLPPTMVETAIAPQMVAPQTPDQMEMALLTPQPDAPVAQESRAAPGIDLSGTSWRLVALSGEPVDAKAELHFDGSSGFAGGRGPCNSYGGEYQTQGDAFGMRDVFTTDLDCPTRDAERTYIQALRSARSFAVEQGYDALVLRDGTGAEVARFAAF